MAMEMERPLLHRPGSPDRAWDVLLDVERIAPCMPGATVESSTARWSPDGSRSRSARCR